MRAIAETGRPSDPNALPLDQRLLAVWPQVVAPLALKVLTFAITYVTFMRQGIRA